MEGSSASCSFSTCTKGAQLAFCLCLWTTRLCLAKLLYAKSSWHSSQHTCVHCVHSCTGQCVLGLIYFLIMRPCVGQTRIFSLASMVCAVAQLGHGALFANFARQKTVVQVGQTKVSLEPTPFVIGILVVPSNRCENTVVRRCSYF